VLEQLGLVGVSWRQDGSEALAEFALSQERAAAQLSDFARRLQLSELAYLATCNRVELLFVRSERTPVEDLRRDAFQLLTGRAAGNGEAERRLRAWHGEGAAEHLFLTAAGLDSACVGETEIVGQVRYCQDRALELGLCGPTLGLVFEEALRIAARVRGGTRLAEGRVSLAEIAVQRLRERIARTPGRIALLGVSPMTERAALSLSQAGLDFTIVNRSVDKAAALAARHRAQYLALDTFLGDPPAVEALLTATGAGEPILGKATLERLAARAPSGQPPLVVDMAVPGDVDAAHCAALGIRRVGMDEIVQHAEQSRAARLMEAGPAREQVDRALDELNDRFTERYYGPLFGALQQRYRRTAHEGVQRLLKKDLKGLGDAERAAIATWAEVLARRFAHIPCLGLRGLLHDGPDGSLEAFLGGLEPEFADELRAALRGAMTRPAGEEPVGTEEPPRARRGGEA
jgi:glutamyl-tRNA reductase